VDFDQNGSYDGLVLTLVLYKAVTQLHCSQVCATLTRLILNASIDEDPDPMSRLSQSKSPSIHPKAVRVLLFTLRQLQGCTARR